MARKELRESTGRRLSSEITGIVLISLSLLLALAFFSFDRADLAVNKVPANTSTQNLIGPVGAHVSNIFFFVFGASAFLFPLLLFCFGLGFLASAWAFLKRRWVWAVVLLVVVSSGLDLFSGELGPDIRENLNAPSVGGFIGLFLNDYFFRYFGKVGAATILGTFYCICLLLLTDFHVVDWVKALIRKRRERAEVFSQSEKGLERRARRLAREAQKLKKAAARNGTADAETRPAPEPKVTDASVSINGRRDSKKGDAAPRISGIDDTTPAAAGNKGKQSPARKEEEPAKPGKTAAGKQSKPSRDIGEESKPLSVSSPTVIGDYKLPPHTLLHYPDPGGVKHKDSKGILLEKARIMQNTLAQFGIEVALGDITRGPTITRYELHPAPGIRLERITALTNNLAAALKAEKVHILAPVPGKSSVGVEVPNVIKTTVILRDLLETDEWKNSNAYIPLALGKDVYGRPIIADLAEMPHLLMAGSTGAGKSVCINSIIASLLYRFTPEEMRFVMIDPKVVELQQYNVLPHLVVPVVTDPKKVVLALRWVVNEMEKRYQIFAKAGVRNIHAFNKRPLKKKKDKQKESAVEEAARERAEQGADGFAVEVDEEIVVPRDDDVDIPDKLSYIVVIIDELADLMLVAPSDVEMAIARITQMARAAGIHCIVATQRPSVDVVTGIIKANIPARIAFQVASKIDSRTILDEMGADKLLGKGDMLYLPPGSSRLVRAQGALVTDQEIQEVVDFIAGQGKPNYEMEIHQQLSRPVHEIEQKSTCNEDEELIEKCIDVIRMEQRASVSLLQRRLRLGYTRAARIMDELENRGIVGPSKGAEPRDILIDLDAPGAPGADEA
ncbi:MAG: DNA translocase FtsK [Verrucomicrobia bacterium]|nr:DNA translocase FtsK [Verrucomicrobiota bacterium]